MCSFANAVAPLPVMFCSDPWSKNTHRFVGCLSFLAFFTFFFLHLHVVPAASTLGVQMFFPWAGQEALHPSMSVISLSHKLKYIVCLFLWTGWWSNIMMRSRGLRTWCSLSMCQPKMLCCWSKPKKPCGLNCWSSWVLDSQRHVFPKISSVWKSIY